MANFKRGDVIKIRFPYAGRSTRQSRPALVVSSPNLEKSRGLLWVLMITSAENSGWPGDEAVSDLAGAGLPAASVIRTAKIATIEAADATKLGKVSAATLRQVGKHMERELGVQRG